MPRPMLVVALSLALAVSGIARAQATKPARERAVRAVVDSFYDAIRRERYDQAASYVMLEPFQQYFAGVVRAARVPHPAGASADRLMAVDPTMPRAVAEWEADRSKRSASGQLPFLPMQFAGITTAQQVAALTPSQALVRWLQAKDPRQAERAAWTQGSCRGVKPPAGYDSLSPQQIAAVAFESDSTAYVVIRPGGQTRAPAGPFGSERLVALHAHGRSWRLEPRQDLLTRAGVVMIGTICPPTK